MFQPDYRHIESAARNKRAARLPLYDHIISPFIQEKILTKKFAGLINGKPSEKAEYFRCAIEGALKMGYDILPHEYCVVNVIQGGAGLLGKAGAIITNDADFEKYPWGEIKQKFFEKAIPEMDALKSVLPPGMKAVGGVGNGVFEIVQELIPYQDLCYFKVDYPETYNKLFAKSGEVLASIWEEFMNRYADMFVLLRFGDDLGFKTGPLLLPEDIKGLLIPQYKKIVDIVHKHDKPFMLHSCGCIFEVMDDIIAGTGIDAKHSNEDEIAPFSKWCDLYGKKIGLFGGIDMNIICLEKPDSVKKYVKEVIASAKNAQGLAIGCGNSIPDYVNVDSYIAMCEAVREVRGE